jgi:hypothetical protein
VEDDSGAGARAPAPKTKRKSSKCNSSAASCGIGTVDGGARGLHTDSQSSTQPGLRSLIGSICDSLRFTAVYCVCYLASAHDNKRGKLLSPHSVVLPCNENPKQPGCERRNSVSSTAAEDSRDEVACPPNTQMHAWHASLAARGSIGLANEVRLLTAEKLQ